MTNEAVAVDDDRAARLHQAQIAAHENRFGEADRICRDLLDDYPDYVPAYGLRGSIAASIGDLPRGVRMLEEAVAARPANLGLRCALCDVYRLSCRLDEALALAEGVARPLPRAYAHLAAGHRWKRR
jgi:predicted Zn-dependent protease